CNRNSPPLYRSIFDLTEKQISSSVSIIQVEFVLLRDGVMEYSSTDPHMYI
ncbi:uncharacterized protein BDW70DRAFT_137763, partial [Aspergillus foveolatus]